MDKRTFIKFTAMTTAGIIVNPLTGCQQAPEKSSEGDKKTDAASSASVFTLPALGYSFDALAPNIDAQTMEIHHGKHHAGYVRKLNAAVKGTAFEGKSLEEILKTVSDKDADTGVRNNGGGHFNHSLFWSVIGPAEASGQPEGQLADAMSAAFGDVDKFKETFSTASKSVFGSGWAWLCVKEGKVSVCSTPNQDNPLMGGDCSGCAPILGLDVWEHAYYLNYQNRRPDYINAFFSVVNWDVVADWYGKFGGSKCCG